MNINVAESRKMGPSVCCYARVTDEIFFEAHDFYRVDIAILRQLGYEVQVTNSIWTLLRSRCDIYYGWWFGYGVFPALFGFFRRKPVIVSGVIHTLKCAGLSGWPLVKRYVMKLTMRISSCSIVCSKGEYDRLDGFQPRNCKIVPLSIDTTVYGFNSGLRTDTVLMVTQLSPENVERKMVLPAIDAFAGFHNRHPEFKLVICGAIGGGLEAVRARVHAHGMDDHVIFTDRVSLSEKISLLQAARVYLQPTSCEGFGLAIGEALACGTPVVTSPEACVVSTYGHAVQYGETPAELAQQLIGLVEDSVLFNSMQNRGLSQV